MTHQKVPVLILLLLLSGNCMEAQEPWQSRHVKLSSKGVLQYIPDADGDIIPDFSGVGYERNRVPLPQVPVAITLQPTGGYDQQYIQDAIDSVSMMPADVNGFRGAILLKAGTYRIPGTLRIHTSGIVLRGEGETKTRLVATGTGQRNLIMVTGNGSLKEKPGTRRRIIDKRVPVGAKSFRVQDLSGYKEGDSIVVYRPATKNWIADIRMDRIDQRDSNTVQWTPGEYGLYYERVITRIEGDRIYIDNPIVMAMDEKYGGGEIYQCSFEGRIRKVGVEDLTCESEYKSDEDEDHGWNAVFFNRVENGWATRITAKHFGYSCVHLGYQSRNITVSRCRYVEPKSQITGGRRYSFNNEGQLNLVMHCYASEGRHDYVTGARVAGPNVFYACKAENAHGDTGPHHRWSTGTLYDNMITDGEINVQDRGNWGTGHGWAGITQVIWNCTALRAVVQNPWASAKNYVIGLKGKKYEGRLPGRPDADWEGQNRSGLQPASLYETQLNEAKNREKND